VNINFNHKPVLYHEALTALNINPSKTYWDGTLGGGGHSEGIVKLLSQGKLIANDLDNDALEVAKERLLLYKDKIEFIKGDYKNLAETAIKFGKPSGILIDMGVSSYQIDNPERGFCYSRCGDLDMRMSRDSDLSAYEVINSYSERELGDIFFKFGEERYSRRIAQKICELRKKSPIKTTFELSDICKQAYPARHNEGHPAKRVFQSVRIEVNSELTGLYEAVLKLARTLEVGGRLAIITFHSLEDRIVKNAFRELEASCVCPKEFPICNCGKKSEVKILSKKPITATKEELRDNKRAESAKMRVAEKI